MMAKVMLKMRYKPRKGLGIQLQGIKKLIVPKDNTGRFRLGYRPTRKDHIRLQEERTK